MKALKVFGGITMHNGEQYRTAIAASSQARAAAVANESLYSFRTYWTVTGNKKEVDAALKNAYKRVGRPLNDSKSDYILLDD